MFNLLRAVPGVVVLHDFFLSGITAHMDVQGFAPGYWARELYSSHGYSALRDRFQAKDTDDVAWEYPCSLSVIQTGWASSCILRIRFGWQISGMAVSRQTGLYYPYAGFQNQRR